MVYLIVATITAEAAVLSSGSLSFYSYVMVMITEAAIPAAAIRALVLAIFSAVAMMAAVVSSLSYCSFAAAAVIPSSSFTDISPPKAIGYLNSQSSFVSKTEESDYHNHSGDIIE